MTRRNEERLFNLDILRLASAIMVLAYHYGFRMGVTGEGGSVSFPNFAPVAIWLDSGFLIFFVISGYVITLSVEGRTAFDFAVGRVARLWPTFMLCATATALVLSVWPVPGQPAPTLKQWLAHLVINARALGQPFLDGAYWTIAYEMMFYGWVFVFMALGLFKRYWRAIVLSWLALSMVNELHFDSEALRKLLITEYSGYFAFGITLYKMGQDRSPLAVGILLASAACATITPFITEAKFLTAYAVHRSPLGIALIGPVSVSVVAFTVLLPTLPVRPALALGLGALTYPLYLLHQHIGYAAFAWFGANHNPLLITACIVGALFLASWLIASRFEPPARRLIRDISGRLALPKRKHP